MEGTTLAITHTSVAFTGTGPIDEGNAVALLNDYLPQALGAVFRPTRVPRSNKSLSAVVAWLEDELKTPDGKSGLIPTDDPVASLVGRRDDNGDDIVLIYLWPEEPSDEDMELVTKARAEDIRVMSLTDALDDLLWEPEPVEPEAEPAAEQGPPWDENADAQPGLQEQLSAAAQAVAGTFAQQLEATIREIVRDEIARLAAERGIAAPDAEPATARGKASKSAAPKAASKPKGTDEINDSGGTVLSPKFQGASGGSDSEDDKITYYMSEEGRYRKAKSRPRRGEQRVPLTPAEVDDLVAKGLVDDK